MLLVSIVQLHAQTLDSIPFVSFKIMQGSYSLEGTPVQDIQLKTGKALPYTEPPRQGGENFNGGVLTLFTGLHTSSQFESLWIFPNEINMTGENNVKIPLIVTGIYEKNRERLRNEDGSKTLETTEQLILHLDSGAWGLFMDQKDTLGAYVVTKRGEGPRGLTWKNQLGQDLDWMEWDEYFGENLEWLKDKIRRYGAIETPTDFTIEGNLNGENFFVVYSGQYFRSILIRDGQLAGVWQDSPYAVMMSRKYKISPYLLLPPDLNPSDFQVDLSILGLAHAIARNLMGI